MRAINIEWNTNGDEEALAKLPTEVKLPACIAEDGCIPSDWAAAYDYISEKYGQGYELLMFEYGEDEEKLSKITTTPNLKFKWNLQKEFEVYKKEQHTHTKGDGSGEYVGSVRTGALCFDIINWGNHLYFDLYVGGVDTGYGHGANNVPYDYCDVAGFPCYTDLSNVSNEEFMKNIETFITKHLAEHSEYTTDVKNIHVNLLDKAKETLVEW